MSSLRTQMRYLNPYDVHKLIVNEYLLKKPGDTSHLKRDDSKDKNDFHIILENHKFLWEEDDPTATWEQQFAKRYYNKLFKEYCIGDLSRYKENKIALRWRIEKEVINGKGQFICGNKKCTEEDGLRTWEVNFGYIEQSQKKNALVKIRLCTDCSKKLNYNSKKREVKRIRKRKSTLNLKETEIYDKAGCSSTLVYSEQELEHFPDTILPEDKDKDKKNIDISPWKNHKPVEQKSRDEEMEEYLHDLLL